MKLIVNVDVCQDHGQCAIAAPDVFTINDDGKLEYNALPDESQRDYVEEAADVCPEQAITIEG